MAVLSRFEGAPAAQRPPMTRPAPPGPCNDVRRLLARGRSMALRDAARVACAVWPAPVGGPSLNCPAGRGGPRLASIGARWASTRRWGSMMIGLEASGPRLGAGTRGLARPTFFSGFCSRPASRPARAPARHGRASPRPQRCHRVAPCTIQAGGAAGGAGWLWGGRVAAAGRR